MNGAEKNLQRLQRAVEALSDAHAADHNDLDVMGNAKQEVEFAFAKRCHQISTKSAYKAASESAKVEFRGNLRYLLASYTGTSATMATGLLAIMTPMVIAAPVTGGLSAGAVVLALRLYLGYQMSYSPAEDGKAKGRGNCRSRETGGCLERRGYVEHCRARQRIQRLSSRQGGKLCAAGSTCQSQG